MKRIMIAALALCLCLCVAGGALASDNYQAPILKKLGLDQAALTRDDNARLLTAALVLMDYMLSTNQTEACLEKLDMNGTMKIAAFGRVSVDVYYPTPGGRYLNLFYAVDNVTDYGTASGPSSTSQYEYAEYPMSSVMDAMARILNAIR